jgi:hypothetical protein
MSHISILFSDKINHNKIYYIFLKKIKQIIKNNLKNQHDNNLKAY